MTRSHLREVSADGVILPGDVAAELYAARLLRGVELHEISAELRIHFDHLLAIEEGRYTDLPGPAYVIGFLRSYAIYLGLDADDMVRRFKAEATEFDAHQDLNALEPYDEVGVPTGALIALALVLVAGAYAGWYYVTNNDHVAMERVPEVPERIVAGLGSGPALEEVGPIEPVTEVPVAPEPVEPVAAEAPAAEASPAPVVLSEEPFEAILEAAIEQQSTPEAAPEPIVEAAPEPMVETQPEALAEAIPEVVAAPPIVEPAPVETLESASETALLQSPVPAPVIEPGDYLPRVFGQANAGSTITLRAREESWVQVTGENNELLLTRILRPGDVYHVPDRSGLMLMTGNAGGIEILVGDKAAPSLGEIGKIRRNVALDPERLLAGTAVDP